MTSARLYRDAAAQLRRRVQRAQSAGSSPGPEQGRRRDVDPFEAAVDPVEMRRDEVAHLGAELVDQEGAARADRPRRSPRRSLADARRQGREGQARQDVIGMVEAAIGDDLLDVGGRAGDRDQPRIVDRSCVQIVGEFRIGVDRRSASRRAPAARGSAG